MPEKTALEISMVEVQADVRYLIRDFHAANIEQKDRLDGLSGRIDSRFGSIDLTVEKLQRRMEDLENWKAWLVGFATATGVLIGFATRALLFK